MMWKGWIGTDSQWWICERYLTKQISRENTSLRVFWLLFSSRFGKCIKSCQPIVQDDSQNKRLDRIILKYIRSSANTSDTICECGRCLTYALGFPHFTIIIISGFSKTGPLSECMNVPWLELFFGPFYIRIKSLQPNLNRITVYCCISNLKMNKKVPNNPHMWLWFWFRIHLLFPSDYALGTMNEETTILGWHCPFYSMFN